MTDSDQTDYELTRIAQEILGDVDVWTASAAGPDGPWRYRSLTVRRMHNTIHIFDVDGVLHTTVPVEDITDRAADESAVEALRLVLNTAHEDSLEAL